jgi:hypothetical protein
LIDHLERRHDVSRDLGRRQMLTPFISTSPYLLDARLDQAGYGAVPMTSEVADALLRGERWLSDRSPSARAICACSRYGRQSG